MFISVFSLTTSMASSAFSNPAVKGILSAFKSVGLPLFGISLLVLAIKQMIALMDGNSVNFGDSIQRIILGSVIYQFGVTIFKYLFILILDVGKDVVGAITGTTNVVPNLNDIFGTESMLFIVVLLVVTLYYMLKTILSLLERFWLLFMTLCMLYLYIPGYITGNDESLIIWAKQCIGYSVTQLFQVLVLVLGMSLYISTGSLSDFALAIGAIIGASKADTVLDKFGQSSGGKMGNIARNGMSSVFYARSILAR